MCAICCQLLWYIPRGIEMVYVCTGLLGEEGRVSAPVDTRQLTEYIYLCPSDTLTFKYEYFIFPYISAKKLDLYLFLSFVT